MVRRHRSRKDDAASWYSGLSASASVTVARRFSSTVGRSVLNWLWAWPELLDLRKLIVQEDADQPVQLPVPGHIDPHRLAAVLNQHGGLGVLEEDVAFGVAPVELDLDFSVQVVV